MASPQMVIRIAANVAELQANLKSGQASIEALGPSVAKMQATWSKHSATLVQDARNITAAVEKVGASTLTAGDSARALRTLEAAMAQLRSTGQQIPPVMQQTADKLRAMQSEIDKAGQKSSLFGDTIKKLGPMVVAAFSVGAIKSFVGGLLDTADGLAKMSEKTGISAEGLQRLQAAAVGGGNTIDDVTKAINKMQVGLAGEDKGVVKALGAVGLSLDTLRGMRPEEQFTTIASAIQKVEDPADRAKLRVLLFGKAGNEIAGTLNQDFAQIAKDATVMSNDTVAKLDAAGDKLEQMTLNIKATIANWLVQAHDFARVTIDRTIGALMAGEVLVKQHLAKMLEHGAIAFAAVGKLDFSLKMIESAQGLKASAKEAEAALAIFLAKTADVNAGMAKTAAAAKAAGKATLDLGEETKKSTPKLSEAEKAAKDWAAGIKAASEQMVWLTSSGSGLTTLIPLVDESGAAMIKAARAAQEYEDSLLKVSKSYAGIIGLAPELESTFERPAKSIPAWQQHAKGLGQVADAFGNLSRVAEMSGHTITASIMSIAQTTVQAFAQGGPWAGAMAFAMSTITAVGNKLFKTEGRKVNDMRDEFIAAAGGLGALNAKAHEAGVTLDALLKAGNVADYEKAVAALNSAMGAHAQALQDVLSKYGLSLDTAPAISAGDQLLAELRTLTEGGVDWTKAVDAMAPAFQKMVDGAAASGEKLPLAFLPILEHLREVGLLTDANAGKIDAINAKYKQQGDAVRGVLNGLTDELTRLNESEAPEEVMGIVEAQTRARIEAEQAVAQEKLKQIEDQRQTEIDALGIATADFDALFESVVNDSALAAAEVSAQWSRAPWSDWGPPPHASDPGGTASTQGGVPGYATGTGGRFIDFGRETLVKLHGRERVMTEREGGNGGAINITVVSQLDGREMARNQARYLPGVLQAAGR